MNFREILKLALEVEASDIHLKAGLPPTFRINGILKSLANVGSLKPQEIEKIAYEIMDDDERKEFEENFEMDTSYSFDNLGRFRVNIFRQQGYIGIVLRVIPSVVKNFKELNLPSVLEKLAMEKWGLVLVTGSAGSGKSTTLASIVEYINTHRSCNIITIEDPIEYKYKDKKSIINQREVRSDTKSFARALRQALRQDPDVILVGEIRDRETMEIALQAAETGHLVLSTLHTVNAVETVHRILSFFSSEIQQQIRIQLGSVLKGIVSIKLIPKASGKGRIPALEIMLSNSRIKDCIITPSKTYEISLAIAEGKVTYGMQTFNQSLLELLEKGLITEEEALKNCINSGDFSLKLHGVGCESAEEFEHSNASFYESAWSPEGISH